MSMSRLDLGTSRFEGEYAIQYTTAAACQKMQIFVYLKCAPSILLLRKQTSGGKCMTKTHVCYSARNQRRFSY